MTPYLLLEQIQIVRDKWQGRSSQDLYRELSDLLLNAGKIPAAMNLLEHSLGMKENESEIDGKAWFNRGLEYADACLFEEACACLNLALSAGGSTFETHYCLAGLHKSLGHLREAELHCLKSLEGNPGFSPAFILLGSITRLDGRIFESVVALQNALLIDPHCALSHYDLACYLALAGETEGAIAALEAALDKGFCDFEWVNRDPDLETLRALPLFNRLLQIHPSEKSH